MGFVPIDATMKPSLSNLLALALVELEDSHDPADRALMVRLREGTPTDADAEEVVQLMACLADEHVHLGRARAARRAAAAAARALA
jgi:hypothetical protein